MRERRIGKRDEAALGAVPAGLPDGLPVPHRYWALAGLWIGMAMSVLDSAIVNIALPPIARDFAIDPAMSTRVVTAYQMAVVMTLLPVAALGERFGYLRVYLAGLVLFVAMSLGCAFAPDIGVLAACRFAQGVGATAMMAVNGAQMRFVWPKARLGVGFGYNALVISCTAAAGPALAGVILSLGPWPWLFLINVPLGFAAFVLMAEFGPRALAATKAFDGQSAGLSALAFGALFLGVSGLVHGGTRFGIVSTLGVGSLATVLLLQRGRGQTRPMVPLDLMAIAPMRTTYGASICAFAAQMAMLVLLPFAFTRQWGMGSGMVGLMILPFPLGIACASPVAGRLADGAWSRASGAFGLSMMATMLAAMGGLLAPAHSIAVCVLAEFVSGIGFGLFQVPNNNVMLRTGPIDRAGAAGGMLTLCRLLGQTAGALLAAAALGRQSVGVDVGFYAAALCALLSAVLTCRR